MNIHEIISKASNKAMNDMFDNFASTSQSCDDYWDKVHQNLKSTNPEMYDKVEDYNLMIKYCNYLVEHALEEYSKHSK